MLGTLKETQGSINEDLKRLDSDTLDKLQVKADNISTGLSEVRTEVEV